jgi:hypothetical protein
MAEKETGMNQEYLKTEGTFEAVAFKPASGWLNKSKEKGTPYIQVGLRVVNDVADEGKIAFWNGYLTDAAIERTVDILVECFNFDGDINKLIHGETTFADLPCQFTTEIEEYKGKGQLKVKWLNPHGYVFQGAMLGDDDVKSIVALVGSKVKTAAVLAKANAGSMKPEAKPASKVKPPVSDSQPPPPEDDVPF